MISSPWASCGCRNCQNASSISTPFRRCQGNCSDLIFQSLIEMREACRKQLVDSKQNFDCACTSATTEWHCRCSDCRGHIDYHRRVPSLSPDLKPEWHNLSLNRYNIFQLTETATATTRSLVTESSAFYYHGWLERTLSAGLRATHK